MVTLGIQPFNDQSQVKSEKEALQTSRADAHLVGMAECGNTLDGLMGVMSRCSVQAVSKVGGCNLRTSMFKLFCWKKNRSFFSSFQKFLPSRLKNNFSFSINSCFTRTLQFFSGSDIVGLRSSSAGNLFCFDREPDGPMCVFYISVLQK